MKRTAPLLVSLIACLLGAAHAATTPYIWTGLGTGWQGQETPDLTVGSATLWLGGGVTDSIDLTSDIDISSIKLTDDVDVLFKASEPRTITLRNGVTTESGANFAYLETDKNITLHLASDQTINVGNAGSLLVFGALTGSANVTFSGANTSNQRPSLLLANLSGTASTFSGTLTIDSTTANAQPTSLALWNSDSLSSSATLKFANGGRLSVHNEQPAINNAITLNSGPLPSGQTTAAAFTIVAQDHTVTLGGNITLANHTTIQGSSAGSHLDFEYSDSVVSLGIPGALRRNAIVFSGTIGNDGSARDLHVIGDNPIFVTGTSSYGGATGIGFGYGTTNASSNNLKSAGGALVYGSLAAMPTGTIQSGYNDGTTFNRAGYVGIAASVLGTNAGVDDFAAFANRISATSTGAIGIDTLPGEEPGVFSGAIDLTRFTTTNINGFRLGTATRAILTGTITPQKNTYAFGNGGGLLTVRSALTGTRNLNLFSDGNAVLGLYLEGANTFNGFTSVGTGYLVFSGYDGLTRSLPSTTTLTAQGQATNVGSSYIGKTELVESNTSAGTEMSATEFLGKFNKTNTWGVIGFDTTDTDSPATVANLDLTGFNNGVFVGTTTAATLTGTITPTSVTNGSNAANALRVTAGAGGTLTVKSTLADLNGGETPLQVIVGSPSSEVLANGTVVFDPRNSDGNVVANTYSGGTIVNNTGHVTLVAASAEAFGTGTITLQAQGGNVGLAVRSETGMNSALLGSNGGTTVSSPDPKVSGFSAPSLVEIGNDIFFAAPASFSNYATLMPTGDQDFILSGNLSGNGGVFRLVSESNTSGRNVTLSGDNSGFKGAIVVHNNTLTLDHNNAAGSGQVELGSSYANIVLGPNATAPVFYGLAGEAGSIIAPHGGTITVNVDNDDYDFDFGGTIGNYEGGSTTASLTVTGTNTDETGMLYLYGENQYTGGTLISGHAALGLGHSNAAGSGTITISTAADGGGLALNTGVTLTNALVFNSGALAGVGTFDPTSVNGTADGPITVGTDRRLIPGIPDDDDPIVGELTLATNVIFADGGMFVWTLIDPLRSDGYSGVLIEGNLDLTALSAASFTFALESHGDDGGAFADMTEGADYEFTLIKTDGGTITGFDRGDFVIDSSKFQGNQITNSLFVLSTRDENTRLVLSFTAVPEPSTYALLALGLGFIGVTCWRRRRA